VIVAAGEFAASGWAGLVRKILDRGEDAGDVLLL